MQVFSPAADELTLPIVDQQQLYLTSALYRNRDRVNKMQRRLSDIEQALNSDEAPRVKRRKLKQARWGTNKTLQVCKREEATLIEAL
ncbi:hypothetical protein LTS18_001351, partial [Coniosporium uncinatum]